MLVGLTVPLGRRWILALSIRVVVGRIVGHWCDLRGGRRRVKEERKEMR